MIRLLKNKLSRMKLISWKRDKSCKLVAARKLRRWHRQRVISSHRALNGQERLHAIKKKTIKILKRKRRKVLMRTQLPSSGRWQRWGLLRLFRPSLTTLTRCVRLASIRTITIEGSVSFVSTETWKCTSTTKLLLLSTTCWHSCHWIWWFSSVRWQTSISWCYCSWNFINLFRIQEVRHFSRCLLGLWSSSR